MGKKLTYEYVKNEVESVKGYKLLSKEYINAHIKLEIQCDKGHKYKVTRCNFRTGNRCPHCFGRYKITCDYIQKYLDKKKYKLLSKTYKNNRSKLDIQCDKNHKYQTTWNSLIKGSKCPHCVGIARLSYKSVKDQIEFIDGYRLLSHKYKNNSTNLNVQCNNGHDYKVTLSNFQKGERCPFCKFSKGEKEVLSLVESLTNKEVIPNDRTQIINPKTGKYLELDIWIPKLKKAIEYNGYYWHSLPYQQSKDKIKERQCVKKDIELLVIKEMDWKNNKERCVNNIKYFVKNEV